MRHRRLDAIGLAMMSLLAGLLWYGSAPVRAQEGPKGLPDTPPATVGPPGTLPPRVILGPPQAPGDSGPQPSCPSCDDQKKKDEPKSPWAKVPSIQVLPPPGYFTNLPTGPGYYSLWDVITDNYRQAPPKYGYPRFCLMINSLFDADFRYLDDPNNKDHDIFDALHRIHLGDCWMFSTGGEFRWRHMHEVSARLTGLNNDYDLLRTRVYGDLWYKDIFRIYVEFIDAEVVNQNLAPTAIDSNKGDLQNAFIELKVGEIKDNPVYIRAGRQELLYGSQRLISPLDWANTRRTFQGIRGYWRSEKLDVDAFYVQPVVPNPDHFDSVDNHQNFAGLWTSYRPKKGHFIDLYYLFLDNTQPPILKGELSSIPYNVHTLGTRYYGNYHEKWLWDVELDMQLGERGSQDIVAGAAAVDGGYHCKDLPWNPTFWAGWEFASGTQSPTAHTNTTFNQLFPFGHYYFGSIDLVGRQNIHDLFTTLWLYPTKWLTLVSQYHHFELASATDALYGPNGVAERRDITGKAGTNVGDMIHFFANFHLDKHSDVMVGYAELFSGPFITKTGPAMSSELFYVMYNFRW
jgi:hypothetical protein